jgi:DNA-binding NarL/FixJ family response regulator
VITRERGVGSEEPLIVDVAIADPALAIRTLALLRTDARLRVAEIDDDAAPAVHITDSVVGGGGDVAVIVITDRDGAARALEAGAAGVLPRHTDGEALAAAIAAAAAGLSVVAAEFHDLILEAATVGLEAEGDADVASIDLTPREREVLQLMARGASNKAIARTLEITPHTAKFHVASILAKLGATGRTDAVARAMRLGLVMI